VIETTTLIQEEAAAGGAAVLPTEKRPYFPVPHPILPPSTSVEAEALYERMVVKGGPEEQRQYAAWYQKRVKRIALAEEAGPQNKDGEPYTWGFELPHWKDADAEFRKCEVGLYNAGGKRATKSERAGKRVVKACMTFKKGFLWCLQSNEETSRATQQRLFWKYLPNWVKAMNGRARHGFTKINYSLDGGFTEGIVVLPTQTEVHFLTNKQDPKGYQGWEIGFNLTDEDREKVAADPELANIGAWLDEDVVLPWVETCETRSTTRGAKVLWTFSTMDGITLAVKEVLGRPRTIKSRKAEVLEQSRKHVTDCPPGHMPYVQVCSRRGWRAMYFHTDLNPFPGNYSGMLRLCEGKSFAYVAENLYGWSEDARSLAWPNFGGWNIIEQEELPADGTNYMLTDPAGRNWATIWVRVAPGRPAKYFIYRDWPDERRYGPWAEPDPGSAGHDGNPDGRMGRAQRSFGYGFIKYKQTWLAEEAISMAANIGLAPDEETREKLLGRVKDPQHRARIRAALEAKASVAELEELREEIHCRYIDPRAGKDERAAKHGATCIIDELAKEDRDPRSGKLLAPRMRFLPAPGLLIKTGIDAVGDLLDWDKGNPLCALVNEPHLYVTRNCQQVIWTLSNYTAEGGEDGGCKDFADLLRYMATQKPRYIAPGGRVETSGGGSY
jgi:hypothetical protein